MHNNTRNQSLNGNGKGTTGMAPDGDGAAPPPRQNHRFDRVELSGAFGDLGTLLPIVVAMILINKLSPSSVFLAFGLFYVIAGFYYRLPIPVQPLKAVGAIAIAYPAVITESVIGASGILFGIILLVLSLSGTIDRIAKLFSQAVVRGIQLTLGLIFLKKGIELIIDKNLFMSGIPGKLAEYPVNLVLGIVVFALIMLILPQIPLTIGNVCVGTADTCTSLFAGIALAVANMAWAFGVGTATDFFVRKMKIKI